MDYIKQKSMVGNRYKTKRYGDVLVVAKSDGPMVGKHYMYLVRFEQTQSEIWAHKTNIVTGALRDPRVEIVHRLVGRVFESNAYGSYRVLRQVVRKYMTCFEVEFLKTGFKKTVQLGAIQTGEIRDPYYPSLCGVGYMGHQNKHHYLYSRWCAMISRCYCKTDSNYFRYGGSGVTVCPEWLCFENFVASAPTVRGFNASLIKKGVLQLDKDISGQKIYSADACAWVTCKVNNQYRRKRNSVLPLKAGAQSARATSAEAPE